MTQGLLDDNPAPEPIFLAHEAGFTEMLNDRGKHLRWRGQIEQVVPASVAQLVGFCQKLGKLLIG